VKQDDNVADFDNSEDETEEEKAAAAAAAKADVQKQDEEPEEYVYKREINMGDGSGVQVFTGKGATKEEALEALTDKLAEAQKNASKKIHDLNQKVKTEDTRTAQEKQDDEYVIQERLKKEPKKTIKEVVTEVIRDRDAAAARSLACSENFVTTHPEYIADPKTGNGTRMLKEFEKLYPQATEFTEEGLEKAYQSLKQSGLLKLKGEGADAATATNAADQKRIASTDAGVTQQRSPKKGSTLSTTGRTAPVVKAGLTEDEAYALPEDKLRALANEQLAKRAQG
jgi:hypothetical protein